MDKIKSGITGVGTIVTFLIGSWDIALTILIVMIVLDYITGVLKGIITKELSSDIGLKGITRKALIFIVLIVSVMLDRLINPGVWLFRTIVCYFYIANEGISILENCVILGLPIPKKLQDIFIQIKDKSEEDEFKNLESK